MRHGIEKAVGFDMIIEPDAGETPFRKLMILGRQRPQRRPFDGLEQWRRLTPSRRMTCALIRSTASPIAAFASASEKKV